ncbi:stalk domain-containing protein [Paenibacillus tuaregi]|uniref:stalk domain-containing protein n=1 Tax=Paenibacillus tuaregi TaxID=1816681 RepID=UPI000837B2BF|nr:stalk domain-containing protein [Paenibacillus tuaregi]
MSWIKKFTAILAAATLITTLSIHPAEARSASSSIPSTPVVLKMNDYYVAYTYPKAPYIDKQNRLIVPLRSVSDLLGAEVSYDNITKTATVKQGQDKVDIIIGSKKALVNGQPVMMDTVAVLDQGSALVPARILLDTFGYKAASVNHVITLKDERLLGSEKFKITLDDDREGIRRTSDSNAFKPLHISFSSAVKNNVTNFSYSVSAKNITGKSVSAGHEDLHSILMFKGVTVTSDSDNEVKGRRTRPAVKKDAVITSKLNNLAGMGQDLVPLEYILIAGRTLN